MKIYTLTGDDGSTSLSNGKRVPKYSSRIEAYGNVDELISWIGVLRDLVENRSRSDILLYIQDQLMRCASILATEEPGQHSKLLLPDNDCLAVLEKSIDLMQDSLPALRNFILPGGNKAVSFTHVARCVCRRAERSVFSLKQTEPVPDIVASFLNRLSDFLFVMARKTCYESGTKEDKWPLL
ncbi:MAG TPA: cob(I)yrinic acid a,c-diamide adenosyltransferase [Bacteroidales bacterium]|nr:cob(I)yrinic acid a,c-diamide adenosyltransferase [Bacteroidales bacterium]